MAAFLLNIALGFRPFFCYSSKNRGNRNERLKYFMKKRHLLKSILATILVIALSASPAFALTSAFQAVYSIGQGAAYYDIDGENANGLQKVNYITYQPNSNVMPIIAYGSGLYGTSTISTVIDFVQAQGKEVIAAINADFFDTATGIPIGMVIQNGTFISSNVGQYAVGFKADGSAVIGKPSTAMILSGPTGEVTIDNFNKARSESVICLLDRNFSRETRIKTAGKNIVLERLDDTPVTVNGAGVKLRVVSMEETAVSTPIGDNQMVLTVAATGPVSRLPEYQVGDILTFTVTNTDSNWQDVQFAVGGKNLVVNGEIVTTGNPTGNHPRSAVGVKADGTLILYEVDGRQNGFSMGMSPEQLAQEMLNLGCVNAINLDGGGSSAIAVQMPGDELPTVVNRPSGGSLRACANYILLINNAPKTGNASNLHLYPEYRYLLPGASTKITVKATDSGYYPTTVPSAITYTVENEMGSAVDGVFTAGNKTGEVRISASSTEGAGGSQYVTIISAIDGLSIQKEGANVALSSLEVTPGEIINLKAEATYKGNAVAVTVQNLQWQIEGNVGSIDENGVFTAGNELQSGSLIVSYNGFTKKIPVNVGLGAPQTSNISILADFENEIAFTASANSNLSLATEPVAYGEKALRWEYHLENAESDQIYFSPRALGEEAKLLAVMVYGDQSDTNLYANITDASGNISQIAFSPAITERSYQVLTATLPEGAKTFTGFTIEKGDIDAGYFFLDQLLVTNDTSFDRIAPQIVFTSMPETSVENDTVQIVAAVTDDNGRYAVAEKQIVVKVDGVSISFHTNASTGNISFTTPALTAGLHQITIEAKDATGNLARVSRQIKVNAAEGAAATQLFADMTAEHWANDYVNFVAAHNLVKGEEDAQGVLQYYPGRNLTKAEFAVIMTRYLQLNTENSTELPFTDKDSIPTYAFDSVQAVYDAGIMMGSAMVDGTVAFLPNDPITRAEVMTVIGRTFPKGYAVHAKDFTDKDTIQPWAKDYVDLLTSLGIVGGYEDGSVQPRANITRAEFAKILFGLY